jgi:crossover junction endodeoxyribonuclease RusA
VIAVELPWPSPKLHPNARVHWAVRAGAAKGARGRASLLTRAAQGRRLRIYDGTSRIAVSVHFYPPDNRRRDTDGMLSALKSSLDGVADALRVDDNLFDLTLTVKTASKPGKVLVQIAEPGGEIR